MNSRMHKYPPSIRDEEVIAGPPVKEGRSWLGFFLQDQEYGVEVVCVEEIRCWEPATPIPRTPDFIAGAINLRGTIVPLINLRRRLGLPDIDRKPETALVLVRTVAGDSHKIQGIIVDSLSEVYELTPAEIRPVSDTTPPEACGFVEGFVSIGGRSLILLDVNAILRADEQDDLSVLQGVVTE